MRKKVQSIERNGKVYYYVDFGEEDHGRKTFRLWINPALIEKWEIEQGVVEKERLMVEIEGLRNIKITEKGNYVLIPSENTYIFDIGWSSGYRGKSFYDILEPEKVKGELPYHIYQSPRGNLGVSTYALIVSDSPTLKVHLSRNGRTYGDPTEKTVEYAFENGKVIEREIPDDPELENNIVSNTMKNTMKM
jgi:hypothetical protein